MALKSFDSTACPVRNRFSVKIAQLYYKNAHVNSIYKHNLRFILLNEINHMSHLHTSAEAYQEIMIGYLLSLLP